METRTTSQIIGVKPGQDGRKSGFRRQDGAQLLTQLPVPAAALNKASRPISHSGTLQSDLRDGGSHWSYASWIPGKPLSAAARWRVGVYLLPSGRGLRPTGHSKYKPESFISELSKFN